MFKIYMKKIINTHDDVKLDLNSWKDKLCQ